MTVESDVGLLRSLRIGMGIENGDERKRVLRAADELERLRVFDLALAISELPRGTLWCVGDMEDGPFARIVWPQPNGGYLGGYREAAGETVAQALRFAAASASVDTHPKGGDAQQAPSLMGSAVGAAETPQPVQSPPLSQGDE